MLLGIDLTSSDATASACALLDEDGSLVSLTSLKSDGDILAFRQQLPAIHSGHRRAAGVSERDVLS